MRKSEAKLLATTASSKAKQRPLGAVLDKLILVSQRKHTAASSKVNELIQRQEALSAKLVTMCSDVDNLDIAALDRLRGKKATVAQQKTAAQRAMAKAEELIHCAQC